MTTIRRLANKWTLAAAIAGLLSAVIVAGNSCAGTIYSAAAKVNDLQSKTDAAKAIAKAEAKAEKHADDEIAKAEARAKDARKTDHDDLAARIKSIKTTVDTQFAALIQSVQQKGNHR